MKKSIKIVFAILCFGLIFLLTSCAARTPVDRVPEPDVKGEHKVLVAYFTWSGHLRTISEWVADETGGELFRILTKDPYPDTYGETTDRAKKEHEGGIKPELSTHIDPEIMKNYDIIYIGFPVWWYDIPMPVWGFLEEYHFEGKTVVPYFSHEGTSDGAASIKTIQTILPKSNVMTDALSIRGSKTEKSEAEVRAWVKKQGHSIH